MKRFSFYFLFGALVLVVVPAFAFESSVTTKNCFFGHGECTTVVKINKKCIKFVSTKSVEFNQALFDFTSRHIVNVTTKSAGVHQFDWDQNRWVGSSAQEPALRGIVRRCAADD